MKGIMIKRKIKKHLLGQKKIVKKEKIIIVQKLKKILQPKIKNGRK